MSLSPCPTLTLTGTGNVVFDTANLSNQRFVLFFYPKDSTPGCTTETSDFRDLYPQFLAANCAIFGLSRDSLKSHENFKAKLVLPFDLISDPDEIACEAFGVMKLKNMYGKQVRGIERSTFVIQNGIIIQEWRGVKVPNHAAQVLAVVQSLPTP
ncbi:peroxiredoxin [uncultured Deefgea sp.]|uniref:peroxiredoxin n=1 Tax=uncultured Deefgea sp. TaxID=1304914 RepID=UPI00262D584B|nr:peroxiredoxin [uncultured Deefgea sp.]